jgi:hypothetical protein
MVTGNRTYLIGFAYDVTTVRTSAGYLIVHHVDNSDTYCYYFKLN